MQGTDKDAAKTLAAFVIDAANGTVEEPWPS